MVHSRYWVPISLIVAVHAAIVVWLLISHFAVTPPQMPEMVMEVSVISPPAPPAPEPPKVVPPLPRPQIKPDTAPPVVKTPVPTPTPVPDPAPQPKTAITPPAPPPPPAPAAAPAPEPVVEPPHFDANYNGNPKPPYPRISKSLGESGVVHMRIFVNADGTVGEVQLQKSSGYPRLDESARETVKHWKLVPARRGSTPVAMWYSLPIDFNLNSEN